METAAVIAERMGIPISEVEQWHPSYNFAVDWAMSDDGETPKGGWVTFHPLFMTEEEVNEYVANERRIDAIEGHPLEFTYRVRSIR